MEQQPGQSSGQKRSAIIAIVVLIVVVAGAFAAYSMLVSSAPRENSSATASGYSLSSGASASTGQDAAILACKVVSADGDDVTLSQVSGDKPLIVNLWATWCPYCVAEMDDYQRLYDEYGDKVQFVMLNVCDTAKEVSLARDYIKENAYTFPVYYDADHEVVAELGVRAYPTTAIIASDGAILMNRAGRIDYNAMAATLAAL